MKVSRKSGFPINRDWGKTDFRELIGMPEGERAMRLERQEAQIEFIGTLTH